MTDSCANIPYAELKDLLGRYSDSCDAQMALLCENDFQGAIALNASIDALEAELQTARSTDPTLLYQQLSILHSTHLFLCDNRDTPIDRVLENAMALLNSLDDEVGEPLPIGVRIPPIVISQRAAEASRR